MVDMGQVIKQLRQDKNWTVAKLARVAGVSRNLIYYIESTGKGTLESYDKILRALGYEFEVMPIDGWGFEK